MNKMEVMELLIAFDGEPADAPLATKAQYQFVLLHSLVCRILVSNISQEKALEETYGFLKNFNDKIMEENKDIIEEIRISFEYFLNKKEK